MLVRCPQCKTEFRLVDIDPGQRVVKYLCPGCRQIVGIDCAAQDRNVGVAIAGTADDGHRCSVLEAATRLDDPVAWIVERVDWDRPVVLALDAPLGLSLIHI